MADTTAVTTTFDSGTAWFSRERGTSRPNALRLSDGIDVKFAIAGLPFLLRDGPLDRGLHDGTWTPGFDGNLAIRVGVWSFPILLFLRQPAGSTQRRHHGEDIHHDHDGDAPDGGTDERSPLLVLEALV